MLHKTGTKIRRQDFSSLSNSKTKSDSSYRSQPPVGSLKDHRNFLQNAHAQRYSTFKFSFGTRVKLLKGCIAVSIVVGHARHELGVDHAVLALLVLQHRSLLVVVGAAAVSETIISLHKTLTSKNG